MDHPVVVVTLAIIAAGCGGSDVKRFNLSGKVTYGGKPVTEGLIVFEPDSCKGNRGPQGFSKIVDGEYQTDKFGKGAVSGALIVQISGTVAKPAGDQPAVDERSAMRFQMPPYTTEINLPEETSTYDFEIPGGKR